ncbi:MAG: hypothetical protein V1906_01950 [Candidatus Woesearchaeota archaeon]
MQGRILTPEKMARYAETRLFGSNVTPEMAGKIELYNGVLPSQLESMLNERYDGFVKVKQPNGREPIYFQDRTLFVPQFSGFGRAMRYEKMIEAYISDCRPDIKFEAHDLDDNPRKTDQSYSNNAYDFVVGMFVPETKYEARRVFPKHDVKNIREVIFGPLDAVSRHAETIEKGVSEYLQAQIVNANGKDALNIGYVFADQAGIILDKMLREYNNISNGKPLGLNIHMFGRVAGLAEGMERHQLVYPTGIIDWTDLKDGRRLEYPMHNILSSEKSGGLNLNVVSVVRETYEQLEKARDSGCVCVEMETRESAEAINQARRRYPNMSINFGFVGYVSDVPLSGDTIEKEMSSDKGETEAAKVIIDNI